MKTTSVVKIMTTHVICLHEDESLESATARFFAHGLHGAPVVSAKGEITGFLTMSDLSRRSDGVEVVAPRVSLRRGGSYPLGPGFHEEAQTTVREVMTRHAIALPPTASVVEAATLMVAEGLHRVPIVSAGGRVVGIVSALDVLRWQLRGRHHAAVAEATPAQHH
jgi:CBS domain-containing protein